MKRSSDSTSQQNCSTSLREIYNAPKFKVKAGDHISTERELETGIRQGCPLSPYRFILVMTILFTDVKGRLNTKRQNEPIDGIHFSEILYADDTLVFGKTTKILTDC